MRCSPSSHTHDRLPLYGHKCLSLTSHVILCVSLSVNGTQTHSALKSWLSLSLSSNSYLVQKGEWMLYIAILTLSFYCRVINKLPSEASYSTDDGHWRNENLMSIRCMSDLPRQINKLDIWTRSIPQDDFECINVIKTTTIIHFHSSCR